MKKFFGALFALVLAASVSAESAVMLRENGPLRVDDAEKGGAVWSITVPAGTMLVLTESAPVTKTLITTKESIPDCKFYKVKYNGKEYLASENEVVTGKKAGVMLRDTTLFTKPQFSSFVNARLEKETMVAAGETVKTNGVSFTEITYYSDRLKTRWILTDTFDILNDADSDIVKTASTSEDDVTAMLLLSKARADNDKENKRINLENALNLKTSGEIHQLLSSEYNKNFKEEESVSNAEPETSFEYANFAGKIKASYGDGDLSKIRTAPKTGVIIASCARGTFFEATQIALEKNAEGEIVSTWYRVRDFDVARNAVSGWINDDSVMVEEYFEPLEEYFESVE